MKHALLFVENGDPIPITADDIKNGKYSRDNNFVDREYEFKLQYVSGARNGGGPYFRFYYSYEDYKRLYPDRADRYAIVANMRKFEESLWHKEWKERFSEFCEIEKHIKNKETRKWKFADAYYEKTKTCIEFQHSYIAWDFEDRNEFYNKLSINTVWLYDLPKAKVRKCDDGCIEILEDNARGFFRISENPDNLKNNKIYIQVESGMIYRVCELFRRESSTDMKSTIRYFVPTEVYDEQQFIEAIKLNKLGTEVSEEFKTLHELWNSSFKWMVVQNIEEPGKFMSINHNGQGEMYRDFQKHGCITVKYSDSPKNSTTRYPITHEKEKQRIWIFVKAKKQNGEYVWSL